MTTMIETTYTVYGVPKDSGDDMSDGWGRPMRGATGLTYEAAEGYVDRNESSDNFEWYAIRPDP